MYDDRLAEFSRERLGGREVPEDLRIILIGHWDHDEEIIDLFPVEFLEPGAPHPLRDHSYLNERERADPDMQCVVTASNQMAEYVQLVCECRKGWWGYWVHPDQPADEPPPPIELDTEAQYWGLDGRSFAEAYIADTVDDEDDPAAAFAELADRLIALGIPVSTRDYAALESIAEVVDPQRLDEELADAERVKRGLSTR